MASKHLSLGERGDILHASMTRDDSDTAPPRARVRPGPASRSLRGARIAVSTVFFLNGVGVASWVVRIPAVQTRLALSPGSLGLALLGMSLGALISMPIAGRYVVRLGSRPVTVVGAFAFAATLLLPGAAPGMWWLFLALLIMGIANGVVDVAMNAQAAAVEKAYARPIMTSFHALFSAGGLVGSSLGGVIAGAGISPELHLAVTALAIALVALGVAPLLLHADADRSDDAGHAAHVSLLRLPPPLLTLGALAFCILFAEGAMADWSAVYLHNVSHAGEGRAAIGYAAFSVTMALGRTIGDALVARFGAARVVRVGGVAATLGVALALGDPRPALVSLGFAAIGAGLASSFPSVLSAASRVPGVPAGAGIALASTVGYTGFLSGPPLIGFVAQVTDLRGGLAVVGVAALLVVWLATAVGTKSRTVPNEA